MRFKYCPSCGKKLILKEISDEGLIPFCEICNQPYFFQAKLCVLVAIVNENHEMVLTKQSHIVKDKWILISGYVKQGESADDTVAREVKEETGQEADHVQYIKSYYMDSSDMMMLGFVVFVKQKPFIQSDEINEIGWFSFSEVSQRILKNSIAEQLFNDLRKEFV